MTPSVRFDLVQPPVVGGPGLSGLIAAADSLLPREACAFDLQTNLLLAGLAFRSYQLDPADNHALDVVAPDLRWATDAIDVDNYGALEALGGHFGVGPRTWRKPSLKDAVALVKHEIDAGRPVIAELGARATHASPLHGDDRDGAARATHASPLHGDDRDGAARATHASPLHGDDRDGEARATHGDASNDRAGVRWALVVGVHAGRNTATLAHTGAPLDPVEVALVADASVAPSILGLTVIRPLPTPRSAGQSRALQHDVLVFGRRHLREKHELIHHADLFYATGIRAVTRTRTLVAESDGQPWQVDLDGWMARWCGELAYSRAAGAAGVRRWADAIDAGDGQWRVPPGGAATLRQLAAALETAGSAYDAAASATTVDARIDALSAALAAEHEMAAALDVLGSGGMFG